MDENTRALVAAQLVAALAAGKKLDEGVALAAFWRILKQIEDGPPAE